jgi:hypothetical protein
MKADRRSYVNKLGYMLETPSILWYSPRNAAVTIHEVRTISRKGSRCWTMRRKYSDDSIDELFGTRESSETARQAPTVGESGMIQSDLHSDMQEVSGSNP